MHWSYTSTIRLQVKRIVPDTMPPQFRMVLLHDALGSIEQWKSFPQQLSNAFQAEIFLYDRQGHGGSSPLNTERPDFFQQEAHEVLPAFIVDHHLEDAIIMGHSDGGTIALLYASRFNPPAAIAIAPHIFVEKMTLTGIRQAIRFKENLLGKLHKYHGEKTETLFNNWVNTWTKPDFLNWNIQQELTSITCPLLLLQGEKDEYGTAGQLEGIREVVPHARLQLIPGLGHLPHLEAPTEVVGAIRSFLVPGS